MRRVGILALGLVCVFARPALSQVMDGPDGSSRGLLGVGSGRLGGPGLSMSVDLDGGYDSSNLPDVPDDSGEFQPLQSGWGGNVASSIQFQRGQADQFLLAQGSGSFSRQQISSGLPSFDILQGSGSFSAARRLGRRAGVAAAGALAYEPTYIFGAFGSLNGNADPNASPIDSGPAPVTGGPAITLTSQRWFSRRASTGAHYNWTSRQRTTVGYEGLWLSPVSGPGFRSSAHTTSANHTWSPRPALELEAHGRYQITPQISDLGGELNLTTTTGEGRLRYTRRLSPSRSLIAMGGVGVVRVEGDASPISTAFVESSPSYSGSLRLDLRYFGVLASANRGITVLNGITPQPFRSDAATLSVDAVAWQRLTMTASAGLVRGDALRGIAGSFDQQLVSTMVRLAFNRSVGLVGSYRYNDHRFRDVELASPGVPLQLSRHSVRLGITFWLPLYGSF